MSQHIDPDGIRSYYDEVRAAPSGQHFELYSTVELLGPVVLFKNRVEELHLSRVFHPKPFKKILDLGCGTARWSFYFADIAERIVAVDFSSTMLGVAREEASRRGLRHFEFIQESIVRYDSEESFDFIILSAVLCYLNDDDLTKIHSIVTRHLVPGGYLFVKEPVALGQSHTTHTTPGTSHPNYACRMRNYREYERLFDRFSLVYSEATCSHLVPFWFENTNHAAETVNRSRWLRFVAEMAMPFLTHVDFRMLKVEKFLRRTPLLKRLLAPTPVVQKFFLFQREDRARRRSLSVVVISFNEFVNLGSVVKEVIQVLDAEGLEYELILVNDGSTDGTAELVDELSKTLPNVISVHHAANQGMGAALASGFSVARKDYLTWLPGDGQIPPKHLSAMLQATKESDFVVTKYAHRPDGPWRLALSHTLSALIFFFLRISAFSGGIYMFKRNIWSSLKTTTGTMLLGVQLRYLYKKRGGSFTTVSIGCRPRAAGQSKVANVSSIFKTFVALLKISHMK